jgi:AcrR family transcriptional regulator
MPLLTPHGSARPELRIPPRQPRAQATIHRIMAGAASAVVEGQQASPSITEVARRGGVTRSAIYRYFPSGEAIRDALFARYVAKRLEEYRAMLATLPEDADARDICGTTIMAVLRASSGQAVGPMRRLIRAEFLAYAQRTGHPFVRGMSAELSLFLRGRSLAGQDQPGAELIFAAAMGLRDKIEALVVDNPAVLAKATTAHALTEWLHQALFPLAPAATPQ